MAIALAASYPAYTTTGTGTGTVNISTPSFTPATGEVLVVKAILEDTGDSFNTPVASGVTFTSRALWSSSGRTRVQIWTGTVTSGGTAITVTLDTPENNLPAYGMVVERWTGATLAASPAAGALDGVENTVGAPLMNLTTTGTNSIITSAVGDWNALDGTSRAYRSSATEDGYFTNSSHYTGYWFYQTAATAGSQTVGMTAPASGMIWSLASVEIQDAGGGSATPAISLRAAGTATGAAVAVTSVNPSVPAGATTGDLSVLTVSAKPYNTVITTPTGWTKIGEATNGTTASGTDTGSTIVAVYVRESAPVGAIGAIGQTNANSMSAVINTYSPGATATWDYSAFTTGGDSTNGANYAATGAGGLSVATGDWVFAGTAINSDLGTTSSTTIGGMSGATLGTTVERTNAPITTGNDTRLLVADIPVTAGSSTAAPTLAYTNASSTSGTTLFLRMRVIAPNSSPTGIASAEAFGTPTASGALTASPTGIATAEAFGTPAAALTTPITASPTGIATAEALGSPAATATLTASPTGIATAGAFGTPAMTGTLTASATGVGTAEAFGTPVATTAQIASPAGIASVEAFGAPVATATLTGSPAGIASAETFGAAAATGSLTASPSGIGTAEALGTPTAVKTLTATAVAITGAEALGTPAASTTLTVSPAGIASGQGFGTPAASSALTASPAGIASAESFGTPAMSAAYFASPSGIPSAEALGTPATSGLLTASPTGIPAAESFGTPTATVAGGPLTASPAGIASAQAFGTPAAAMGPITATATAIGSLEAIGTPAASQRLTAAAPGIASVEAFGTPAAGLTVVATATAIGSLEVFGSPSALSFETASPDGIPGAEAFGTPDASTTLTVQPDGIGAAEAFGTPEAAVVQGPTDIIATATAIVSLAVFGYPAATGAVLVPTGRNYAASIPLRRLGGALGPSRNASTLPSRHLAGALGPSRNAGTTPTHRWDGNLG